ncbi:MAG TPA: RNA polymerase sigma factor [Gammaproteobacteria bacterium]|nr:RNA polymerase sigma factor [Gammaproteobacteria bacterium]
MDQRTRDIHRQFVTLMPRLRRFAVGLCNNSHDADDLLQSTYARALTRLQQWQDGTHLDRWLFRIMHSVHINSRQTSHYRQQCVADNAVDLQQGGDARREMETWISLQQTRRMIADLPEQQKIVLLLVCVEGMSYKETAEVLELPIGTVTSRLARARICLAKAMAPTSTEVQKNRPILRKVVN